MCCFVLILVGAVFVTLLILWLGSVVIDYHLFWDMFDQLFVSYLNTFQWYTTLLILISSNQLSFVANSDTNIISQENLINFNFEEVKYRN